MREYKGKKVGLVTFLYPSTLFYILEYNSAQKHCYLLSQEKTIPLEYSILRERTKDVLRREKRQECKIISVIIDERTEKGKPPLLNIFHYIFKL